MNRKINYLDEGELTVVPEVNRKRTGLRWKARKPRKLKFVDDGLLLSKINMDSGDVQTWSDGSTVKTKHDIQSQNVYRRIVARAESRGMVVNPKKTAILCMPDAQTFNEGSRFPP